MWVLSIPLLLSSDSVEGTLQVLFDEKVLLTTGTITCIVAGLCAGAYLILYAVFMFRHTPRAVPAKDGKWRSDRSSAYRPHLFAVAFLANAVIVVLFVVTSIFIIVQVGWAATPVAFRVIILFSLGPYIMAFLDGIVNSNSPRLTSFLALLRATPSYLLSSVWFAMWLPAYASARFSDLSWGNRDNGDGDVDSSKVAKYRAHVGKMITATLVLSNFTATVICLCLTHFLPGALRVMLFACTAVMSVYYLVAVIDMIMRLVFKFVSAVLFITGTKKLGADQQQSDESKMPVPGSDATLCTRASSPLPLPLNEGASACPLDDDDSSSS
jgi:hypothetical protein